MAGDHRIGRSVTGGISVKAAGDLDGLVEEGGEPLRVGAGAGGGDTAMARIKGKATDGVDGLGGKSSALISERSR